mmetsp:Transcript_35164/g.34189  ORF Transcript_35164/g.34189 Transcript_35164/m.34189 type:complete len:215 (+) Transcript_35164:249-893(+)
MDFLHQHTLIRFRVDGDPLQVLRELDSFIERQVKGSINCMLPFLLALPAFIVVVSEDFLQFSIFPPHVNGLRVLFPVRVHVFLAFVPPTLLDPLLGPLHLSRRLLLIFLLLLFLLLAEFLVLLVLALPLHGLEVLVLLLLVAELVAQVEHLLHLRRLNNLLLLLLFLLLMLSHHILYFVRSLGFWSSLGWLWRGWGLLVGVHGGPPLPQDGART